MMAKVAVTQDILEALADPIVLVDQRRQVVAANLAARGVFSDNLTGRSITFSVRHPDVLEALEAVIGGGPSREVEVTLTGTVPRSFKVRTTAIGGAGEQQVLISFHDTAATRYAERMRADFVANVSHELRSPLTSLLGFIETLRGPARDDAAARDRFLDVMNVEAKRMARLINDLLSLSRVESEEHLHPAGQVDVPRMLSELASSLDMRAGEREMEIEIDCEKGLPMARGDQDELTLVFRNLIDNAISYGRAGTRVTVKAVAVERIPDSRLPGISVSIRDQGEGIAAEHIPRLTERFYRVDKGRSRSIGGTGLGLAIVKHVVSRHRGRLVIDSTVGKGSIFTVYLPRAAAPERCNKTDI